MQLHRQVHHSRNLRCLAQSVAFSYFLISRCCSLKQMGTEVRKRIYTEAYLGHEKKKLLSCPGKIIILPGQLNVQLSCPGKIIILPGQDN